MTAGHRASSCGMHSHNLFTHEAEQAEDQHGWHLRQALEQHTVAAGNAYRRVKPTSGTLFAAVSISLLPHTVQLQSVCGVCPPLHQRPEVLACRGAPGRPLRTRLPGTLPQPTMLREWTPAQHLHAETLARGLSGAAHDAWWLAGWPSALPARPPKPWPASKSCTRPSQPMQRPWSRSVRAACIAQVQALCRG